MPVRCVSSPLGLRERRRHPVLAEIFAPSAPSESLPQQGDQSSSHGAVAGRSLDPRRRFIGDVLRVPRESGARVVMTLRGDFYGYATTVNRALSDVIAQTVVNVGPMTPEELQSAIEQPAVRCRLRFEAGLVWRILREVDSQPGSLALLEFALTELWNKRRCSGCSDETRRHCLCGTDDALFRSRPSSHVAPRARHRRERRRWRGVSSR